MRRQRFLLVLLSVLLVPILAEGQGRTVSRSQNVRDEVWGDHCEFDPVTWSYHCISVTAYSTDDWITGEVFAYLSFYDDLVGYGSCEVSADSFYVDSRSGEGWIDVTLGASGCDAFPPGVSSIHFQLVVAPPWTWSSQSQENGKRVTYGTVEHFERRNEIWTGHGVLSVEVDGAPVWASQSVIAGTLRSRNLGVTKW